MTAIVAAERTFREDEALYQEIADNALVVTGARLVSLSWYDPGEQMHRLGAIAPRTLFDLMIGAVRAVLPRFSPQVPFRADVNPATRAVLIEGRALLAPFMEHAAGTMPAVVLRVATATGGLRWTHSVPLLVGGKVTGALAFHFTERPEPEKLLVAEAFAKQVALTLENTRLLDALRQRAEELERSRERIVVAEERTRREIAELLHSRIQARLLVATHRLWECRAILSQDPAKAAALLGELTDEFDRIREEDVRQVSHLLHPSVIRIGLLPALQQLAEDFEPQLRVTVTAGVRVTELDHPARNALPEPLRLAVYRFVDEALANVARHAGVDAALVTVDFDGALEPALCVTVRDEGPGFDVSVAHAGIGLRSMQDRVEQLRGTLAIASAPGSGTTLTARLPLGAAGGA